MKRLIWITTVSLIALESAYAGPGQDKDEFCEVTLSATKFPRSEKDKEFSKDFTRRWKVKANHPTRAGLHSVRAYAEEVRFVDVASLLKLSSDSLKEPKFTQEEAEKILDLYYQGKLQLTWSQDMINFSQYCAHREDPFHTLAVTSQKNITYFRQQRYADSQYKEVGDVLFDTKYQIEYWLDEKNKNWTISHPTKDLVIKKANRKEALYTIKKWRKKYEEKDDTLSFFVDPHSRWMREVTEKASEEEPNPPLLKVAFIGWLALTGDTFSNIVNRTAGTKTVEDEETPSYGSSHTTQKADNLGILQEYANSLTSVLSNFSPYVVISPLLVSFLSSKEGKIGPVQLFASILFPIAQSASLNESQGQERICENGICTPLKESKEQQNLEIVPLMQKVGDAIIKTKSHVSLMEGRLEYNEKDKTVEQFLSKITFSTEEDGTIAKLEGTVIKKANKLPIHQGWKHEDQKLISREIFEVWGTRKEEKRSTGKTEYSDIEKPHEFIGSFVQPDGEIFLKDCIPLKQNGYFYKKYKRPDDSTHIIRQPASVFPLEFKHVRFVHDGATKKSHQVVKLGVMVEGIYYNINENYPLTCRPFLHLPDKIINWDDDRINHKSIGDQTIDISIALDRDNIRGEESLAGKVEEEHEKLWRYSWSWVLPGANYRIRHNGETYW
ncbi:MAG: hypothetical protein BGO67_05300 [Alphaproteobacteria bacterium 41-28]|nr:MAG: hypothetical protein BGO67_05300 [Alphaproteobacteria bacterium 41-28]